MEIKEYRAIMVERNKANATHNMTKSPEYHAWRAIKDRCYRESNAQYKDYGGRGITMCNEWRESFMQFYNDIGARPDGHSIDRINNDKSYCKENCRWATKSEQANNRTDNVVITYEGKTMTLVQWSVKLNMPHLWSRLARGWSMERAVTQPYIRRNKYAS